MCNIFYMRLRIYRHAYTSFMCNIFYMRLRIYRHAYTLFMCNISIVHKIQISILAMFEAQYLDLLHSIVFTGKLRETRNAITHSIFSPPKIDIDLTQSFPLLDTRKIFYKGIKEELLWFISGSTNSKKLSDKGVRIWNKNSSREFLDNAGLTSYSNGDCGPIYGFQWRHYNASYNGCDADYTGQGIDQLAECIRLIKEDPTSRRILMHAWNPEQLSQMALPPCHVMYQFYADGDDLSCSMYQRSSDVVLGLPFNIASLATLTHLVASVTGKTAKSCHITIGDAHIYNDHLENVLRQLSRRPILFGTQPQLVIKNVKQSIDEYTSEDFDVQSYFPQPAIKFDMIA